MYFFVLFFWATFFVEIKSRKKIHEQLTELMCHAGNYGFHVLGSPMKYVQDN